MMRYSCKGEREGGGGQLKRESKQVSNVVFYAQSTITVISGRKRETEKYPHNSRKLHHSDLHQQHTDIGTAWLGHCWRESHVQVSDDDV